MEPIQKHHLVSYSGNWQGFDIEFVVYLLLFGWLGKVQDALSLSNWDLIRSGKAIELGLNEMNISLGG